MSLFTEMSWGTLRGKCCLKSLYLPTCNWPESCRISLQCNAVFVFFFFCKASLLWADSMEGVAVSTSSPLSGGGSATPLYALCFLWSWYLKSTLPTLAFPQGALLTAKGKRADVTMIISSRWIGTRCQVRPAVLETRPGRCGGLFVQTGPRTGLGSSLAAGHHSCWKGHSNATSRRAPSCWDQQEAGSQVLNCFLAERDWKSSPCGDSASHRHVWDVELEEFPISQRLKVEKRTARPICTCRRGCNTGVSCFGPSPGCSSSQESIGLISYCNTSQQMAAGVSSPPACLSLCC